MGLEEHQWWDKEVRRGVRGLGLALMVGQGGMQGSEGVGLEEPMVGQGGTQGSEGVGLALMVGQGGTQGSEGVGLEEHQWWDKEVRRGVRGWGWRSTNGGTRRYAGE